MVLPTASACRAGPLFRVIVALVGVMVRVSEIIDLGVSMLARVLERYARRLTPPPCPKSFVGRSGAGPDKSFAGRSGAGPDAAAASALGPERQKDRLSALGPERQKNSSSALGPERQEKLPPVLRELAELKAQRPRVVRREIFAAMMVEYLREEGFTGWHLPEDIEEVANWMYRRHNVEPLHSAVMLGAVARLPGVRHQRLRLLDRPELATIRIRLRARGQKVERAYLYYISEAPPVAVAVIDELPATMTAPQADWSAADRPPIDPPTTADAPKKARPSRGGGRSSGGQRMDRAATTAEPAAKPKKYRTIADVRQPASAYAAPGQAPTRDGHPERQLGRAA